MSLVPGLCNMDGDLTFTTHSMLPLDVHFSLPMVGDNSVQKHESRGPEFWHICRFLVGVVVHQGLSIRLRVS